MATIYDVAKLAGVSHTAASAVLSGRKARIGEQTRQRILDAAKQLDYTPNRAAQQLATGKFNTIALCFERADSQVFVNPTANQLTAGVWNSASDNGLFLLFAPAQLQDRFEHTVKSLPLHGVDGAIIIGPIPLQESTLAAVDNCSIPLVCIDCYPGFTHVSTVDKDNALGMRMGVEHLISCGHRSMMYLGPPPSIQCHLDRMRSFYDTIHSASLPFGDQATRIVTVSDAARVVHEIAEIKPRPTAIVCGEGNLGLAVWEEAKAVGMRIPDDLDILTFDDPPVGHPAANDLNIIKNMPYEMGKAAGDLLRSLIDGDSVGPVSVRIPPQLSLRPCPGSDR